MRNPQFYVSAKRHISFLSDNANTVLDGKRVRWLCPVCYVLKYTLLTSYKFIVIIELLDKCTLAMICFYAQLLVFFNQKKINSYDAIYLIIIIIVQTWPTAQHKVCTKELMLKHRNVFNCVDTLAHFCVQDSLLDSHLSVICCFAVWYY